MPVEGPQQFSGKLQDAQRKAGGRHYTGPGLGVPPPWTCPTCGRDWQSDPSNGCPVCIAEAAAERAKAQRETTMTPERTGRLVQHPTTAAPEPATIAAAVSPLVAQRGLAQDRLVDAIAEAVVNKLTSRAADAAVDAAQIREEAFPTKAHEMYATYVGLQLVLQFLNDGAEDPLLPPAAVVLALLRRVEALPELQKYLAAPPSAAPIPEEPQA
jgi:hypothetical protein